MEYTTSTLLMFGGLVFLVAAAAAFCLEVANLRRRTPVQIKITKLHPHKNSRGTTFLHPEYVVVSGPQAGLRKVSTAGSFSPFHTPDDIVDGYLDLATNEVRSVKECRAVGWLIATLAVLGIVMLALGVQTG